MDLVGQKASYFLDNIMPKWPLCIDGMVSSKYTMVNSELLLFDWVQNIGPQWEIVHFFLPFRLAMHGHQPSHATL